MCPGRGAPVARCTDGRSRPFQALLLPRVRRARPGCGGTRGSVLPQIFNHKRFHFHVFVVEPSPVQPRERGHGHRRPWCPAFGAYRTPGRGRGGVFVPLGPRWCPVQSSAGAGGSGLGLRATPGGLSGWTEPGPLPSGGGAPSAGTAVPAGRPAREPRTASLWGPWAQAAHRTATPAPQVCSRSQVFVAPAPTVPVPVFWGSHRICPLWGVRPVSGSHLTATQSPCGIVLAVSSLLPLLLPTFGAPPPRPPVQGLQSQEWWPVTSIC